MNPICILLFLPSLYYALNQLSFSGGGSFGAVEIGILKKVLETNPTKNYDFYTGISAGALNAAVLSYYKDVNLGANAAEKWYSTINNRMVYELLPNTGISLLNTYPLKNTVRTILENMPNEPLIHTLVGTTNLYSGKLDIYNFEDQDISNKILLLLSSCAIPGIFPPIEFNGQLYADGGTLSNELINVEHDNTYLNITFISPYEEYLYNNTPVNSLKDMLCRTLMIILNNYNDPIASLNQNCKNPIGEINKYYVPPEVLKKYNMLNFNDCEELINIGYNNVLHKKYNIC